MADLLYQRLEVGIRSGAQDSVHLESFPLADPQLVDKDLEAAMEVMREVVNLGRNLREKHRIRVRQPLPLIKVATGTALNTALRDQLSAVVLEELNVKAIEWVADASALVQVSVKANFKVLGRKLGKRMKPVANAIAGVTEAEIQSLLDGETLILEGESIALEHVIVVQEATGEGAVETSGGITVELDTRVSEELKLEGLARELVSKVQAARKEAGLAVEDRIVLSLKTDSVDLQSAISAHKEMIAGEVLAASIAPIDGPHSIVKAGDQSVEIAVQRV
jgi:isoleucyl-tRNA synthetase